MTELLPPYVSKFTSQHGADRLRFRRKGFPSYYFVNRFGTVAFEREYAACMKGEPLIKVVTARKRVKLQKPAQGFIYFVGGRRGPIKIGYSTDVRKRLAKLRVGSSQRLSLMAKAPGTMEEERRMHRQFSHLRIRGEWFRRDPEIIAEIARIKQTNGSHEILVSHSTSWNGGNA